MTDGGAEGYWQILGDYQHQPQPRSNQILIFLLVLIIGLVLGLVLARIINDMQRDMRDSNAALVSEIRSLRETHYLSNFMHGGAALPNVAYKELPPIVLDAEYREVSER